MLADERDQLKRNHRGGTARERHRRRRHRRRLQKEEKPGCFNASLVVAILGFMSIWSEERNRFAVLYLANRVNNVSYERYVIFVPKNASYWELLFLRVLYNDWVSLRCVTGYNELHNGFFKTLILSIGPQVLVRSR